MKFITDRREIGTLLNIRRIPVVRINIGKPIDNDALKDCYKGDKIIVNDGKFNLECTVEMFGDEKGNENHKQPWTYKKIFLEQGALVISNSFTYTDAMKIAEWNRCPIVYKNDEIIVIFYDDDKKFCVIRHMKVDNRIDRNCYTVTELKDIDE